MQDPMLERIADNTGPDELAGRFRPTPAVPLDPSPGTRQGIINEKGDLSCPQSMFAISAASTNRWRSN